MFAIPFFKFKLNSNLYDKQNIVKTIEKNYQISEKRNQWDIDEINPSDFHHSNKDENNHIFEKINYDSLAPSYNNIIQEFLKKFKFLNDIKFKWEIVNYTVCNESQYMNYHDHIQHCDFFMVHYVQFDKENHKPTLYKNTHIFSDYVGKFKPKIYNSFIDNIDNSWLREDFHIEVDEDDIVIVPSVLPHMVPPNKKSAKNRITIVTNIIIE